MGIKTKLNNMGITLIELLVALVIGGIIIAGIYRVFVAQSKAYTVQDQVIEVQQSVRSAMEVLLRDIRMAGFDNDATDLNGDGMTLNDVPTPITPGPNSITVMYDCKNVLRTVAYQLIQNPVLNPDGSINLMLMRNQTPPDSPPSTPSGDPILENVNALNFTYGIDQDETDKVWEVTAWVDAAGVGASRVIAVRVTLTATPTPVNPDVQQMVSPRTLNSTVALRNLCLN
jgi:type IV pilus assembly protein PilW